MEKYIVYHLTEGRESAPDVHSGEDTGAEVFTEGAAVSGVTEGDGVFQVLVLGGVSCCVPVFWVITCCCHVLVDQAVYS